LESQHILDGGGPVLNVISQAHGVDMPSCMTGEEIYFKAKASQLVGKTAR
jgi:hypothetical protein